MSEILKEKGNQEFKRGNYEQADSLYEDAITLSPENGVLYSNRAMSLIKLEDWETCVQICEDGLKHTYGDDKTRMKLLWRQGIAYMNRDDFPKSRNCFNQALSLEKGNKSILSSLNDLERKESQFKRSRSEESLSSEKRLKPETIIKIPIYEVDQLPNELVIERPQKPVATESKNPTSNAKSENSHVTTRKKNSNHLISEMNQNKQVSNTVVNLLETPTIYHLSSIIKTPNDQTYNYVFNLPSTLIKSLFAGGNLDSQFLNFFLCALNYVLDKRNELDAFQKALDILNVLTNTPRFSLISAFSDKALVNDIKNKFVDHTDTLYQKKLGDTLEKWG